MIQVTYDDLKQYADIAVQNGALIDGEDLSTAVLLSIFTYRRAADAEINPAATFQGGSWQDTYLQDLQGSRLWLLRRKSATQANLLLAQTYIQEALQWMLDDGVASKIEVATQRGNSIAQLQFTVNIYRPGDKSPWSGTWRIQFNAL